MQREAREDHDSSGTAFDRPALLLSIISVEFTSFFNPGMRVDSSIPIKIPLQHVQASVLFGGIVKCDPNAEVWLVIKPDISTVLMPGETCTRTRTLDNKLLVEEQALVTKQTRGSFRCAAGKEESLKFGKFLMPVRQESAVFAESDPVTTVTTVINRFVSQRVADPPQHVQFFRQDRCDPRQVSGLSEPRPGIPC